MRTNDTGTLSVRGCENDAVLIGATPNMGQRMGKILCVHRGAVSLLVVATTICMAEAVAPIAAHAATPINTLDAHLQTQISCKSLSTKSVFCAKAILTADEKQSLDRVTGLVPPKSPYRLPMSQLPSGKATDSYVEQLHEFLKNRELVLKSKSKYTLQNPAPNLLWANNFVISKEKYFVARVGSWNGSIFWAPASKSDDVIIRAGDEVRSVFGPIPTFDVTTLGARSRQEGGTITTANLPLEVDGNQVILKHNPDTSGSPLQFEHRDLSGNVVKWTPTIEKCDKPSLAGGVTPCGAASRLSRTVVGNVEWIALARKTKSENPPGILQADSYWSPDDPDYALLGYIGFNRVSGEVAFFDGSSSLPGGERAFNWNTIVVQPGGTGYGDEAGRRLSASMYDPAFRVDCAACHDNKEPRIITPYIKQARVGYRDSALSDAFSLGDLLPELTRNIRKPYRVVGSAYTAVNANTLVAGRAVEDPTGECASRCHGLTNLGTARFAADSVGRLGTTPDDDPGIENNFRTEWALRSGAGKIHPWMLPETGNDLSGDPQPEEMSDASWEKLLKVLQDPASDPKSLPLFTEAPAPESPLTESARIGDTAGPEDLVPVSAANRDGAESPFDSEIHVTWKYLNNFGGVPTRDDVRFNLAIVETDIPIGTDPTPIEQYPTIEQTKGLTAAALSDAVLKDGKIIIFRDISYSGHFAWTDPVPATSARQYRVDFPATKGKRYLLRLLAKRHTFDQSEFKFSDASHVLEIDIK